MKLSISNIGWSNENDVNVYELMKKYGYSGLEIAPTRIFPEAPYDKLKEAGVWVENFKKKYGLCVSSMQSIWFGRQEKIFGSKEERQILVEYTKKAIDFASAIGCRNLVFGCPRNRNLPEGKDGDSAVEFFKKIGDYAASKNTIVGMEANPTIYNTNYVNDTLTALQLIKKVDSKGFLLNLDVGTMIQNEEAVSELVDNVEWINHVHISEPGLKPIQKRDIHMQLKNILLEGGYKGFISIEVKKQEKIFVIENMMEYIGNIFADKK